MDALYKKLQSFGQVRVNAPLAKFSSFKIGGPADYLLIAVQNEALVNALNFLSAEGVDYFILGGGTNVLFSDDGWRGCVIVNKTSGRQVAGQKITADAGVELKLVVDAAQRASLAGFEWAAGIPGTVGGAVRGNAGARYAFTGGEIKDTLVRARVWNGSVTEYANADCVFGYRDSVFKHSSGVVLSVEIELKPGNVKESLAMTQKILVERRGKQPGKPSAGSFFKNVMLSVWPRDHAELPGRFLDYKKIAAGWLIEQAGLKGYRVGGAVVSPEHANFIVNLGGASGADVLAIVEVVTEKVYTTFGVTLEPEAQIVR